MLNNIALIVWYTYQILNAKSFLYEIQCSEDNEIAVFWVVTRAVW
jgi:hypothetical protein